VDDVVAVAWLSGCTSTSRACGDGAPRFTVLGAVADLKRLHPAVYGALGMGISHFTDVFGAFFAQVYLAIERALIWIAVGWRRVAMGIALVTLLSFGLYFQHLLKIGDTTPGAALLYPRHPYNLASPR